MCCDSSIAMVTVSVSFPQAEICFLICLPLLTATFSGASLVQLLLLSCISSQVHIAPIPDIPAKLLDIIAGCPRRCWFYWRRCIIGWIKTPKFAYLYYSPRKCHWVSTSNPLNLSIYKFDFLSSYWNIVCNCLELLTVHWGFLSPSI